MARLVVWIVVLVGLVVGAVLIANGAQRGPQSRIETPVQPGNNA